MSIREVTSEEGARYHMIVEEIDESLARRRRAARERVVVRREDGVGCCAVEQVAEASLLDRAEKVSGGDSNQSLLEVEHKVIRY